MKDLTVINTSLNKTSFAPKTFFSFPHGFVQEKIIGSSGYTNKLTNNQLYLLGQQIATIHSLNININQQQTKCLSNGEYISDHFRMTTSKWLINLCFMEYSGPPTSEYLEQILNSLQMSEDEFYDEVDKMGRFIKSKFRSDSFCHNDLHFKNILIKQKQIIIIDFDHAGNGYTSLLYVQSIRYWKRVLYVSYYGTLIRLWIFRI